MSVHDVGKIQINQNLRFLAKEWRVQRLGWVVFALLLLLGLAGALGRGPLTRRTTGDDALRVEYESVLRHAAISDLTVTVGPSATPDSTFRLYLSADYLAQFDVQTILPEPQASGFRGAYAYFDFARVDPAHAAQIVFHTKPAGYWRIDTDVAIDGKAPLHLEQLILP
jgi:hypothetical protein